MYRLSGTLVWLLPVFATLDVTSIEESVSERDPVLGCALPSRCQAQLCWLCATSSNWTDLQGLKGVVVADEAHPVELCLQDPHEVEATDALMAAPLADEDVTAADIGLYFAAFHRRMDEYKAAAAHTVPPVHPLEWRSAIERIIPLCTEASFAGFEAYLPPTVAAAVYTWSSVVAYRQNAGGGLFKLLSSEWRARQAVADALANQAARTLAVGPGMDGIKRFVACYAQCIHSQSRPRMERIMAAHARYEALDQWREEWDALEASYDEGDIDHDEWTLGKEDLLARHP